MDLHNIALIESTNSVFRDEIARFSKIAEYPKGSNPFYPEVLLRYFYVMIEGRVKTYQINFDTNKEQTIFIYKRGDMFDVVSLLDSRPHEVVYEVIEDCKVLQIPIEIIRKEIEINPEFNRKFFPYLAAMMRHTEDLASDLSLYETKDRLINLLLDSVDEGKHFRYQLIQNLSNGEIAKLLGTIRHVVERTLKQLKEDKIIDKNRKMITILDFEKLLEKTSKMLFK